jgi:carbamate kinase
VDAHPAGLPGSPTAGMIGYLIEQELGNLLSFERPFATLLTMVEEDPQDPAFDEPATVIGPLYEPDDMERLRRTKGWAFKPDGHQWRRVVPAPEPKRIFELRPIKWLLERNTIVIAEGGGSIPTMYDPHARRRLVGVECVVDQDLTAELLARQLGADLFVLLTDTDAVYVDWGTPSQRAIRRASPAALGKLSFASGSMGPKVEAARRFAIATGKTAAIGALPDLEKIIAGQAGTTIAAGETPAIAYETTPRRSAGVGGIRR